MVKMSKTANKIRELSKKAASEKIAEQQQAIEKNVNQDIAIIEKILAMVKDRLVYKEVTKVHSRRKTYVVVTEDIVLHDYSNRPDYGSGTEIKQIEGGYYSYPHTQIIVNGHIYLHASDLITKYKYEANKAMEKAEAEYRAAADRKEAIENLADLEPVIKELMLNYQGHLGIGPPTKAEDSHEQ